MTIHKEINESRPELGTCGSLNILYNEKWLPLHVLLDKFVWVLIIFICLARMQLIFIDILLTLAEVPQTPKCPALDSRRWHNAQ